MTTSDNTNQNLDSHLTDTNKMANEIDDSLNIVTPIRKVIRKKKLTDTPSVTKKADGNSKLKKKTLGKKPVTSNKKMRRPNKKTTSTDHQNKSSMIGISVLFILVVSSAILIVQQVNKYRKSFAQTQVLRDEANRLETEWHQLLLEQQAVGGTTRISGRAQMSMNMYLPKQTEIYMVNLNSSSPKDQKITSK